MKKMAACRNNRDRKCLLPVAPIPARRPAALHHRAHHAARAFRLQPGIDRQCGKAACRRTRQQQVPQPVLHVRSPGLVRHQDLRSAAGSEGAKRKSAQNHRLARFAVCSSTASRSWVSPRPSSYVPALAPTPRKLKRIACQPACAQARARVCTTLLCMAPPCSGCGWAMTATPRGETPLAGASASASIGPAPPSRVRGWLDADSCGHCPRNAPPVNCLMQRHLAEPASVRRSGRFANGCRRFRRPDPHSGTTRLPDKPPPPVRPGTAPGDRRC